MRSSEQLSTANSVLRREGRRVIVELDPDHPGFRDRAYRSRRDAIAAIAWHHLPGTRVPDAPYSEEEHQLWRTIQGQLRGAHQRWACREFHRYVPVVALSRDRIPQLNEVSARLMQLTGFRLEPVGGLVDAQVFLRALGDGVFLSTQYIRHHSTPAYTPEPDVVHELVGHAALLASPTMAALNRKVGETAQRLKTEAAMTRLARVYWFTLEFGVLREGGALRAYGSGLLSSSGELEALGQARLRDFDLDEMAATDFDVTDYQPALFCADSFGAMVRGLDEWLDRLTD